jgi:uncharacterized membrane protein YfcA
MPELWVMIAVAGVMLVATFVRSAFGFADGLLAMPLLALVVDMQIALTLVAFTSVMMSILVLRDSWRSVDVAIAWRLVAAACLGIPLGLLFFKGSNEKTLQYVLAGLVISFAAYRLWSPDALKLNGDGSGYLFGFVGGVLGGAYNIAGLPIVIFGSLRSWPLQKMRGTLQCFFLPTSILVVIGHGFAGWWKAEVGYLFLAAVPCMGVAFVLGSFMSHRIPAGKFDRYICLLLVMVGTLLLIRALWAPIVNV